MYVSPFVQPYMDMKASGSHLVNTRAAYGVARVFFA